VAEQKRARRSSKSEDGLISMIDGFKDPSPR
jgi:hypothetical protein